MKALDYFQLYFTEAVWNLIVEQTNLYTKQKRTPDDGSVSYPAAVDKIKTWVAMIPNMRIVQKPTILLYWRRVVMDLMEKFLDKGYVLLMDNYFSSVPLFQEAHLLVGQSDQTGKGFQTT